MDQRSRAISGTPATSTSLKNKCRVDVFGRQYTLRSDADDTYAKELASLVDQKMRELAAGIKSIDPLRLAVFTAINLAHELHESKKQRHESDALIGQRTSDLIESIEGQFEEFRPESDWVLPAGLSEDSL